MNGKSFVNFTNHTSANWGKEQTMAAQSYGNIIDVPFPAVPPAADTDTVVKLAVESIKRIEEKEPACVLCQGEFTLSYHVIKMLKEKNIPVVCACSERNTTEEAMPDGSIKKVAVFNFVQFREY